MTYYFLIPVFNESRNVETLANRIIPLYPDQHKFFVFVDDGLTDRNGISHPFIVCRPCDSVD